MTGERVIYRHTVMGRITRRRDVYMIVLDKQANIWGNSIVNKPVVVRMLLNGTELAVRGRVTIEKAYRPPRLRIFIARSLAPTMEKYLGMTIPVIIEYEEGEENRISTSG